MKKIILFSIPIMISLGIYAQSGIISEKSFTMRKKLSAENPKSQEKIVAETFLVDRNLPVREEFSNGAVMEIKRITPGGKPVYIKTSNLNAAATLSTDQVWNNTSAGLSLSGSGVVVGLWDGGIVRHTHHEFDDRVRIISVNSDVIDHATHVAGTIGASGKRSDARGMADRCGIDSYYWGNETEDMRLAASSGMIISNHSYGIIHGWNYNPDREEWLWFGDVGISDTEDHFFGFYGEEARTWDKLANDFPDLLIVTSAGNDRDEGPSPGTGHFVWLNGRWTYSEKPRLIDGNNGFDCIGSQGTSKNILTVGAIHDLPNGYQADSEIRIANFSSFGPTDDGRIKPDIVGNGIGLISCAAGADDGYFVSSGTSMSSPNVSGSLALLQEHYKQLNGRFMNAAMLKALVLHTAEDLGNPGPDYKYGWGVMNTYSASTLISGRKNGYLMDDTLYNRINNIYDFYSPGEDIIKVTIVWNDPAGEVPEPGVDPADKILINDLDIRLIRASDKKEFLPFILFPDSPDSIAATGDNELDNIEQIVVDEKMKGHYQLVVSHKDTLLNPQSFSLVTNGLTPEYIARGYNELRDNNGEVLLTTAGEYINDMNVQWLINPENGKQISFYFVEFSSELNNDVLRVYDGSDQNAPLIAQFSGHYDDLDTLIVSSTDFMFLEFISDDSIVSSGFKANYCTVEPEGIVKVDGDPYPCSGTIVKYEVLRQPGADYLWSSENNWQIFSESENQIQLLIGDQSDLLFVQAYNRCGSTDMASYSIVALSSPPELGQLTGDTMPCTGSLIEYAVNHELGADYYWQFPSSWLGSSNENQLPLTLSEESGEIKVFATNSCGKSSLINRYISVQKEPESESIFTDKMPVCSGSTQEFYVNSKPGFSYEWSVNDDWQLIGNNINDTVQIKVGTNSSYVIVLATNKCGDQTFDRLIIPEKMPEIPMLIIEESSSGDVALNVTNTGSFERIQWYFNGMALQGISASVNPLIVSRNGLYNVASVSDKECLNLLHDDGGVLIDSRNLDFLVYRKNAANVVIENNLKVHVKYKIVGVNGITQKAGIILPGINELDFTGNGFYLIHIYDYGDNGSHVIKVIL